MSSQTGDAGEFLIFFEVSIEEESGGTCCLYDLCVLGCLGWLLGSIRSIGLSLLAAFSVFDSVYVSGGRLLT